MSDSFQTVSSQNWFQRIQSSLAGILLGVILVAIGIGLLWWNEGNSVATAKALTEGRAAVVTVDPNTLNAENENKLIHLTGLLNVAKNPIDSSFEISKEAVKLSRQVEMFQWVESSKSETKQKLGGGEETVTTFTYDKQWSRSLQNSANFQKPEGHQNPAQFPFESRTFTASGIAVGAFSLGDALVNSLNWFESYPVAADALLPVPNSRVQDGFIYIGQDPANPAVGDMKVSFEIVPLGEVSLVARQSASSLTPFPTRAGQGLALIRPGNLSADELFTKAEADNQTFTWVLRIGGFILIFIGMNLIANPFAVAASVVPFLGKMVGAFTGFASFLLSAALSFFVIAMAWLAYRPVLGVTLLLITGALIGWAFSKAMKKKPKVKA